VKLNQNTLWFRGIPWLLLAVLFYCSIIGIRRYSNHQNNPQHIYQEIQKEITDIESDSKNKVKQLISTFDTITKTGSLQEMDPNGDRNDHGEIFLFVYKDDTLIYWNNNSVILPVGFNKTCLKNNFSLELKNGWYGFHCERKGKFLFLGSYLIKSEFPFQNEFIKNQFSPRFKCPASVSITTKTGTYPVYSGDKTCLFNLEFNKFQPRSDGFAGIIFLLFILGSLGLLYFILQFLSGWDWFKTRENILVITFAATIVFLRIVQIFSGFPAEIYHTELFTPAWYSSSAFLPSLGDFTMNVLMLVIISFVIYKKSTVTPRQEFFRRYHHFAWIALALFTVLILFQAVGYFTTDLVINSSLSLNLHNISALTYESMFGLFIIAALLGSLWLISAKVFDAIYLAIKQPQWLVFPVIAVVGIYLVICWFTGWDSDFMITLFFVIYVISYWYVKFRKRTLFPVQNLLFFLCFYTVFATFLLNGSNKRKETEKLSLLAGKLVTQRNPVTEVLYEQVERRILADSILSRWMNQDLGGIQLNWDTMINYLKSQYFKDYWKKYQIQVTICDPLKELRIQPQGYLINCNDYFRAIISNYGKVTALPNLFFLDYGFGKEFYIAILSAKPSETNSEMQPVLFIEFNLKNGYPDPGYPSLLMDMTRVDVPDLLDYSYGLFQHGRLVRASGSVGYKTELAQYKKLSRVNQSFTEDKLIHFQYRINNSDTLLISKTDGNFLTFATPFSYLFILFSAIALLIAGVIHFPMNFNFFPASLRNRLHFLLIGILVMTMLAIGIVQGINIVQINLKKNVDSLRERAYSVVVEVQHKYGIYRDMGEVAKSTLEDFLVKLSNVFFTDVNVYNDKGMLISSSRPQIFEEGMLSERMDAKAFRKLVLEKNSIFVHNELIGAMQFNSAYLPFYNERDQLLGFVNLPYFAKQDEAKKEISSFLVTFLNVYILLILFGILVTALISNYITAPLAMLAGKISQLRLGKVNEKINWSHNDEIGQLVSVYNMMIDELGKSAEMLARSERESAWREMARQVAHEIKNPLTPMKLSAQYLEKAWNEKAPDWDSRLARFTKTIVEQIDALSVIASDFSDFAKMPAVVLKRISLEEVIMFVLSLYQDTTRIKYEFQTDGSDTIISGDRSQLIRLFTNLLNNAVQAIGDHRDGIICIHIGKEHLQFIIKVSDNGCGISAERTSRIFQPDFTTKTSGMGLGLAIVKGIVEGMNGEISFTSTEQKGTTFIIKFPTDDQQVKTGTT